MKDSKTYIWVVEAKFEWENDFIPLRTADNYGGQMTRAVARELARSERAVGGFENVRVRKYQRVGK